MPKCWVESKVQEKRKLVEEMAGKVVAPEIRCRRKGGTPLPPNEKERYFWSKVAIKESGCWEWSKTDPNHPYGTIHVTRNGAGTVMQCHRFSWLLTFGEIPTGLKVLHRCDNPACVRPDHLWLGTMKDNAIDRENKGRANKAFGEGNGKHKLTVKEILEIRRLASIGISQRKIAKEFSVSHPNVKSIVLRRTWRHVL